MITIITGKKDVGKTSYLESWFRNDPRGTGFFSRKVFDRNLFLGYDLFFFPQLLVIPFIRLTELEEKKLLPEKYRVAGEAIRKGRFSFSCSAFQYAEEWGKNIPLRSNEPIWIDEIGSLELSNAGFDSLFRQLITKKKELRVIFREALFDRLVEHYAIVDYIRVII